MEKLIKLSEFSLIVKYALIDLTRNYKKISSIIITLFISLFILSSILTIEDSLKRELTDNARALLGGDLEIDYHHLVEDLGIALGQAFSKALGDKSGIKRYGYFVAPMDETLVTTAVDLSNRPYLFWQVSVESALVRDFNIQLFKEFFQSFANEVACNLHIRLEHGEEPHHVAEGIFKSLARCMDMATTSEPRLQGKVPSTKGTLSA